MESDGDLDDVWDKMTGPTGDDPAQQDPGDAEQPALDLGAPLRVTFVIRADRVPVAPWAQGWRVGALGPDPDGHVTLVAEHDIDLSPVAQLSAVTGLLGTVKAARLELEWWAIQARGPLPGEHPDQPDDIDRELADLLDDQPDPGD